MITKNSKRVLIIGISISVLFFVTYIILLLTRCNSAFDYISVQEELALAIEYFMLSVTETIAGAFIIDRITKKGNIIA